MVEVLDIGDAFYLRKHYADAAEEYEKSSSPIRVEDGEEALFKTGLWPYQREGGRSKAFEVFSRLKDPGFKDRASSSGCRRSSPEAGIRRFWNPSNVSTPEPSRR